MSERRIDIESKKEEVSSVEEHPQAPASIADAGSTKQATQGAGENLSETSEAVVWANCGKRFHRLGLRRR